MGNDSKEEDASLNEISLTIKNLKETLHSMLSKEIKPSLNPDDLVAINEFIQANLEALEKAKQDFLPQVENQPPVFAFLEKEYEGSRSREKFIKNLGELDHEIGLVQKRLENILKTEVEVSEDVQKKTTASSQEQESQQQSRPPKPKRGKLRGLGGSGGTKV